MGKLSNYKKTTLLSCRSTPLLWCNLSPCELLMERQVRTLLPQVEEHLNPTWPYLEDLQEKGRAFKAKQKRDFDRRRGAHPPTPQAYIKLGTQSWTSGDTNQDHKIVHHT
jgi:hypothetical protein